MTSSSPPPPPPCPARRRLLELLKEKQEPFLLEVYLMENGYSARAIKCETTSARWPSNACMKLKSMLAKFIHGIVIQNARNKRTDTQADEGFHSNYKTNKEEIHKAEELLRQKGKLKTERPVEANGCLELTVINELIVSLEKQTSMGSMTQWRWQSGFSVSREEWRNYQHQVGEVGVAIEALIFEEIREEAVLDLLDFKVTWRSC